VHPWAAARQRGKVLALEMDRGSGTTPRRKLTDEATTRWLFCGEGGGLVARGATLSFGKAPGSAHKDGKRVRRLNTDGVVKTEARRGGGGLPKADKRR
jgi:hypothetical protein